MELILRRIAKKKSYTIGRLYIEEQTPSPLPLKGENGHQQGLTPSQIHSTSPLEGGREGGLCDTLEPTWRDYKHGARKIKGCSAIPEGRYPVVITWSPKFQKWLPLLLHVPLFDGIRIHAGNTSCDTEGCILVGENRKVGMVLNSNTWVKRLKDKIVEAKERGEGVWITIQ